MVARDQQITLGECEVYLQRVSHSTRIPGDNIISTLENFVKRLTVFLNGLNSGTARSTCSDATSEKSRKRTRKSITWIGEDGTEFLRGGGVLDNRKACIASRTIVIVHRNIKVRALEV